MVPNVTVWAAFAEACQNGDMHALAGVLDPGVISRSDGGGNVHTARKAIIGAGAVSTFLLGDLSTESRKGRRFETTIEPVNARSGLVLREHGAVTAVVDLAIRNGKVLEVAILVNPDKLH